MAAERHFTVDFGESDFARIIMRVINHPNAQQISEFLAFQLMESSDHLDQHLVKLLNSINPVIEYNEGQPILIAKRGVYAWQQTDELMLSNNLMVDVQGTHYLKGIIKDINKNRPKPYLIQYEQIKDDEPTTKKTTQTWAESDKLRDIADLDDFDKVK
jgi:hypothetical protein